MAGCAPATQGNPPPEYLPGYPEAGDFEDIDWYLESCGDPDTLKMVLDGTEITIRFSREDGQVSGNAGANSYSGVYQLDGVKLTIGPLAQTEMYRLDPEGVMEQEAEYLQILQDAQSYEIIEGRLVISSGDRILIYINNARKEAAVVEKSPATEEKEPVDNDSTELSGDSQTGEEKVDDTNATNEPEPLKGPTLSNLLSRGCTSGTKESIGQAGLSLEELAVDFTLNDIEGNPVNLSSRLAEKPVLLIMGSFT